MLLVSDFLESRCYYLHVKQQSAKRAGYPETARKKVLNFVASSKHREEKMSS